MRIRINKFLVLLTAVALLAAGACTTDTPQNNGGGNNRNAPNRNTSPANQSPAPATACSANGQDFRDAIEKDLARLKDQFKEFNPQGGTASFKFENQELTFKGYLTGEEKDIGDFFKRFDKFRRQDCVKKIIFQGDPQVGVLNFEWRAGSSAVQPNECKKKSDEAFTKHDLSDQLSQKNFAFVYDEGTKVLTINGFIIDTPGKDRIFNLMGRLGKLMSDGCITKIVFGTQTSAAIDPERSFSWTICIDPQIECNGVCANPPCVRGNSNDNTTSNGNANSNAGSNVNANAR